MTRDNVERKQARTEDERIEDEDDEFIEEAEEGKLRNNYRSNIKLNVGYNLSYKAHSVVWENINLEYFRFIGIRRLNFSLFLNVC